MLKTLDKLALMSPSMRREWIEMIGRDTLDRIATMSPSMRREWIEMNIVRT